MIALSGIHELKVTVRESWPLTIVPPVPPDRPLATNQFKNQQKLCTCPLCSPAIKCDRDAAFQEPSMMAIMVKA